MKKWHFPIFYAYDEAIDHKTWRQEIYESRVFNTFLAAKKWCRDVEPDELEDCSDFHDRSRYVIKGNPKKYFHENGACYLVFAKQQHGWVELAPSPYLRRAWARKT